MVTSAGSRETPWLEPQLGRLLALGRQANPLTSVGFSFLTVQWEPSSQPRRVVVRVKSRSRAPISAWYPQTLRPYLLSGKMR